MQFAWRGASEKKEWVTSFSKIRNECESLIEVNKIQKQRSSMKRKRSFKEKEVEGWLEVQNVIKECIKKNIRNKPS